MYSKNNLKTSYEVIKRHRGCKCHLDKDGNEDKYDKEEREKFGYIDRVIFETNDKGFLRDKLEKELFIIEEERKERNRSHSLLRREFLIDNSTNVILKEKMHDVIPVRNELEVHLLEDVEEGRPSKNMAILK